VAAAAAELGLDISRPEKVRDRATTDAILELGVDALVVAAFGQILPARLLEGPRFGGINVHASLLPRWRGAAPVAAAILAGDEETGVSIMRMDAGVDTGPVYAQRQVPIPPDATTQTLTAELAELGAELLVEVLELLERGEARAVSQDDSRATRAPLLTKADGYLDWSQCSGVEVDRRVRALQPWPGVVARLHEEDVQLLRGGAEAATGEPGTIVITRGDSVVVAAREGGYRIDAIRPPGRREMSPAAYLRGRR
jgi:methionyl-tRNA formyltransferase